MGNLMVVEDRKMEETFMTCQTMDETDRTMINVEDKTPKYDGDP